MIRLVIADDNPAVRDGLRAVLRRVDDVQIVGEAADGRTALKLIERLNPHVVLLDHRMPGLSGAEVAREVRRTGQRTKVVFFTGEPLPSDAAAVADGSVLKGTQAEEIIRILRHVAAQL